MARRRRTRTAMPRLRRRTLLWLLLGVLLLIATFLLSRFELWRREPLPSAGELTVVALDVGQGDSFLILTPERKAVLIDAGPPEAADRVREALARYGVTQLDLVIATHPHADHIGGMVAVLDAVPVRLFLDSGQPYPTRTYTRMLEKIREKGIRFVVAEAGQEFELGAGVTLSILAPSSPRLQGTRSDENANSIVARLSYGAFSMLFTGDSERETEDRLIERENSTAPLAVRVLKVAHHGSRHSTTRAFLERVRPEVAIISCGADNEYGHPAQETLDRLRRWARQLHRTDLEGEIVIRSDGRQYEVRPERTVAAEDLWRGRRPRLRAEEVYAPSPSTRDAADGTPKLPFARSTVQADLAPRRNRP
ncbi:MAG: MBL fold metallo-hydrolase [Blastocatellia bacterium]|nr:MBL fold metallo-hydrolase [Blastocatellia bacterium]MCS7156616.1 MBL fold metallo-hydrolase [Blastocatellia bacterium]MCX7751642.1 MBL fold metallo-hydrolase [Blastocatellia bacterium]MDW8168742.1 ComEC/Rec2 family competence protein [Acidobacteriota bacterium]MDW8257008.1 ComEC/Rec2 family competence protein [Acidobacteriota bacterium]